ncbi:MAG: aminotransferase class I/II-fold pyridoxal phosphate-dependent enzyme [Planctomycetota bacterium]|nr:aminotransferase class I/II-fold pyridoxal phosphate-dependent enzyme [Planctomycetota bacterium]
MDDVLDLSTGVAPEPQPSWLAAQLAELAPEIGHYPDPDGEPARSALAEALGVPLESLLVAGGAQAFVEVLFQALDWKSLALREPGYGEVRRCAERVGIELRSCTGGNPWPQADARWVTDPDGFTGERIADRGESRGVLDESYAPFDERCGGVRPGWIRVGSLTKCFSIPGLRLGYAIAPVADIERIRRWLPPWPTSALALHLLPRLLPEWSQRDARMAAQRSRLRELLHSHGWETRPGEASFVLARPTRGLPDFAAHRILVRSFEEWPELGDWVRIGIPPEAGWPRLEAALCP